jgi:hypothetical protein
VTAGLHEQHSEDQQSLITSRNMLCEAFGAFNRDHRSTPKSGGQSRSPLAQSLASDLERQQLFTGKASNPVSSRRCGGYAQKNIPHSDVAAAPSVKDKVQTSKGISPGAAHRDNDDVEEKRRKALDAKLLRALVAPLDGSHGALHSSYMISCC